ncbi:MAG: hypothetical protein KJO61_03795 [Deltaproteobacteria bacterium]|nr:hypothetical protein [Deltaproteobacteria bacterium]
MAVKIGKATKTSLENRLYMSDPRKSLVINPIERGYDIIFTHSGLMGLTSLN